MQRLWLRPARIRPKVLLTSGQRRGRDPGALQPPSLAMVTSKKEIMTLCYRTLLLLFFKSFSGSGSHFLACGFSALLSSLRSSFSRRSPFPPDTSEFRSLHSTLLLLLSASSSLPGNISFHSLPATSFVHIFEHQPRKAIWPQINAGLGLLLFFRLFLSWVLIFARPDQFLSSSRRMPPSSERTLRSRNCSGRVFLSPSVR